MMFSHALYLYMLAQLAPQPLYEGPWVTTAPLLKITPDPARGRRPACGVAPPGAARASSGESAPPQAGGRALHAVQR